MTQHTTDYLRCIEVALNVTSRLSHKKEVLTMDGEMETNSKYLLQIPRILSTCVHTCIFTVNAKNEMECFFHLLKFTVLQTLCTHRFF